MKGFTAMALEGWTFDKRVPVALIGVLVAQIVAATTFYNGTNAHLKQIDDTQLRDELAVAANHKDVQDLTVLTNNVNTHMAVNDEKLRGIDDKLSTLVRLSPASGSKQQ